METTSYRARQIIAQSEGCIELTLEASGVGIISADLAVHLDEPLHGDGGHLTAGESILQAVAQEDVEGKGLPELVRTWRGVRRL